jgi:hypothetical protein
MEIMIEGIKTSFLHWHAPKSKTKDEIRINRKLNNQWYLHTRPGDATVPHGDGFPSSHMSTL